VQRSGAMAPVQCTEHENALDQHVAYFFRKHPEIFKQHAISRIRPGWYNFDGRQISVEWQHGDGDGYLVAVDGPLRQPFKDYVQGSDMNAQFDNRRLPLSNLQQIPKERQLSFGNMHKEVSRLEAMKIAKEQALVREMAAEYAKDGQRVPESALIERYKKTIDKKLGKRSGRTTTPAPPQPATASPPAASGGPIQPPWWQEAKAQAQGQTQQQNCQNVDTTPVFCSKHDATEKRKKIPPRDAVCTVCKEVVHTNYAEVHSCHACSRRENRCLCCGDHVGGQQQQQQQQQQQVQGQGQQNVLGQGGQGQPNYCQKHDHTEKRKKTQPRNVECRSCNTSIQTNYVDFMLCAPCSQAEQRCLCCGTSTAMQSAQAPLAVPGLYNPCGGIGGFSNLGCPPMQSLQSTPKQAMNGVPPQSALPSFNHVEQVLNRYK
jgi:hypothetical protein